MKELKLEVGKTYVNRKGEEIKIVWNDNTKDYPFRGSDDEWYRANGRCVTLSIGHPNDLIEEVPETRHTFEIPEGVKEITLSYEGKSLVVEMVPTAAPKPGDVCLNDIGSVYIFKEAVSKHTHRHYAWFGRDGRVVFNESAISGRPATPEEAQLLWDALKKAGKRWNAETMQVEEVPERERIMDFLQGYGNNVTWNYEQLCLLIEGYLIRKEYRDDA